MKQTFLRASAATNRTAPAARGLTVAAALAALTLIHTGCGRSEAPPVAPTAPAPSSVSGTNQPASPPVARPEPVSPSTFLSAAYNGDLRIVSQALDGGVDVNVLDAQNRSALMLAAFNGHARVVERLLDAGARLDDRDEAGRTALMFAASGDNAEAVRLLLKRGASVNLVDTEEHWTALMFAAGEGHTAVVKELLAHGADRKLKDVDGDTARNFAVQKGHADTAAALDAAP